MQAREWTFEKKHEICQLSERVQKSLHTHDWARRSNRTVANESNVIIATLLGPNEASCMLRYSCIKTGQIFSKASSVSPVHLQVHLAAARCIHMWRLNTQIDRSISQRFHSSPQIYMIQKNCQMLEQNQNLKFLIPESANSNTLESLY